MRAYRRWLVLLGVVGLIGSLFSANLNRFSRILNMALMLLGAHYSIGGTFCCARGGSVPLPT